MAAGTAPVAGAPTIVAPAQVPVPAQPPMANYGGMPAMMVNPFAMGAPPYPYANPYGAFSHPFDHHPFGPPMTPPNWGRGHGQHIGTPSTPSKPSLEPAYHDVRSSSPPIPDTSLDDFCALYGFNAEVKSRLENMEFDVNDDVSSISESAWKDVGFTELSWRRVVKALRKMRKAAKS